MLSSRSARFPTRMLLACILTGLVSCSGPPPGPVCGDCSSGPDRDGGLPGATGVRGRAEPANSSRNSNRTFHASSIWDDPAFHGTIVRAAGYDYTRAFAGNLPCSACHAGESPLQPSPHGLAPNCFACHDGGPDGSAFHPEGWMDVTDPNFHGNLVVSAGYDFNRAFSGALPCSACHGGAYPDEPSRNSRAPSCYACHAGGPDGSAGHPKGWSDPNSPNFHGRKVSLAGFRSPDALSCSACHSPWQGHEGINTRAPSCHSCHAGGPDGSPGHPEGWADPADADFHGKVVKQAGSYKKARSGSLTCNTCHAGESPDQPSPVARAPSCFSCHAGGPDGSAHPPSWSDLGHPAFHGAAVKAAGGYTRAQVLGKTCNSCHAGDDPAQRSPVPRAPNCHACHAGGPDGSPGHPGTGWTWGKGQPGFHGTVVKAAGDYTRAKAGGLTCNTCHAGDSRHRASPVARAPSCFSCHEGGPTGAMHPAGWKTPGNPDFHGTFIEANGGANAVVGRGMTCALCHGTQPGARSPWPDAPNCSTCHAGGQVNSNLGVQAGLK